MTIIGHHLSEETKAKMSAVRLGQKHNETIVYDIPQLEVIPGTTFKRLINHVKAYSVVLGRIIHISPPFVYDEESTPWRGENPIAGLIHDYVSRKGVLESKILAARVYLEFQRYEDSLITRKWYTRAHDCIWRGIKAGFVAICPDFIYWHKLSVNATYKDMI